MSELLLLSGGLDSAALASWCRPAGCVFVDYGQRASSGEKRSAQAVADALGLPLETVAADCSAVGAGTLLDSSQRLGVAPTPEWWPFRNQLLVTLAAAVAVRSGKKTILIGTVCEDASRHADGSPEFMKVLDALLACQEGGLRLRAPAHALTTAELIERSGIADEVLGWTHSCHFASTACGCCNGCRRRLGVLKEIGRLV